MVVKNLMHDIFLSYSRNDDAVMQRVKQRFLDAELRVWTDEGIQPGTASWRTALEDAIAETLVLVCICSPDAKNSRWVQAEISRAEMHKKPIYLILARGNEVDAIPFGYEQHQYIDIREESDFDNSIQRLVKRITNQIGMDKTVPKVDIPFVSIAPPPPPASPSQSPIQQALQQAQDFAGIQNSDWDISITTLGEIIPDTPLPEMEMCLVPVGSFRMGSDAFPRENPSHRQTLSQAYWIARYPVTNEQWRKAVEGSAVGIPQGDYPFKWHTSALMTEVPVVGVSWFEALRFCNWLNGTGESASPLGDDIQVKVSLPTEPTWEYAARGLENWRYPWGDDWDADKCIYKKNSSQHPHPVKSKSDGASWIGAMHMSGNVWEWQLSEFRYYPYVDRDGREGNLEHETTRRILRGGSWYVEANLLRTSYRDMSESYHHNHNIGFRFCVMVDGD